MPEAKITIEGDKALMRALKGFKTGIIPELQKASLRAGNAIRNTAIKSVQQGSPRGKSYKRGSVIHKASAPGQPPATDTGQLVQKIKLDIDSDGLGGSITSKAPYSSFLEFGTKHMKARPFMVPALEANRKAIVKLYRRAMDAANRRFAKETRR